MYPVGIVIERTVRRESGKVLAGLIRVVGDFQLAEDCLQDALQAALERWPVDGIPEKPAAWLTTVSRRKALDRLRRESTASGHSASFEAAEALRRLEQQRSTESAAIDDERLRLIFTCCHPALGVKAALP